MKESGKVKNLLNEKGQMLVLVALSLLVILACTALAIDVGIAYGIKSKLNAAVDGASIAAGRAVKRGANDSERVSNARDAAERFLNANYPAGYMGSALTFDKNSADYFSAQHNADGSWTIAVNARARTPNYFARAVGWNTMNVRATAEVAVRDLDMILVLDTSGSLDSPPSPSGTFEELKSSAVNFINRFSDGVGGDRIGLISFASGAVVDVPIDKTSSRGFDKAAVTNAINALTVGGSTASGEAMRRARQELDAVPSASRSSLRVIVFFSDGAPNDVAIMLNRGVNSEPRTLYSETPESEGQLCRDNGVRNRPNRSWRADRRNADLYAHGCSVPNLPDRDWTDTVALSSYHNRRGSLDYQGNSAIIRNTKCSVNKAARNMVENVANTARGGTGTDAVTIYTLGLGERLRTLEIPGDWCGYGNEEHGENILKRLANTEDSDTFNSSQPAGMYVFAQDASQLDRAFQTIARQILRITK